MRILLVDLQDELTTLEDVEFVDASDVAEARRLLDAESWNGIVVDLRSVQIGDALDALGAFAPLLFVGERMDVKTARAAFDGRHLLFEASWLADGGQLLVELLVRQTEFAKSVRELGQLRERQAQLVHNEKFAAVGLLAAEIAHEINNPGTFVITNLTVMDDYVRTVAEYHEALRDHLRRETVITQETFEELEQAHEISFLEEDLEALVRRSLIGLNRIHQIVQDLRYFGTDRQRESDWVDVDTLVRAALNLVRHEARFRAELIVDLPHLPSVRSDASRLSQVILNLLVNAVQSVDAGAPDENEVRVSAEIADDVVVLSIEDTGSGMSPELVEQVFEPFFTTKAPGSGSGLGLSISKNIMESLGGEIRVASEVGVGSRFDIVIPRGADDD